MENENEGLDYSYDSYLGQVPEALRGQIEPVFKAYSENLQNKVNENYGQFDPYKSFIENGYKPEHLAVGMELLEKVNTDPQSVFQAMITEYPDLINQFQQSGQPGQSGQQLQQQQQDDSQYDLPPQLNQEIQQMKQVIDLLFQGYQQQNEQQKQWSQQQEEQSEIQAFKADLDKIAPVSKYPRNFILSYIAEGQTPEQAVKSWDEFETSRFQKQNSSGAPLIAPGGGGTPSQNIDTSKLSDKERAALMVQYLNAANQQR